MSGRRAALLAGGSVMLVIIVLLAINLTWVVGNWDTLRPVGRGGQAPALDLPRAEGGRARLADHRGQVVLVSFWASWCGPCLREMPLLAQLQHRHGKQGFIVLAINVEGNPDTVRQVRAAHPAARDLTMLLDVDGEAARSYGVQTLPHLVLVDREGRVIHVHVGGGGAEELEQAVQQALHSGEPTRS